MCGHLKKKCDNVVSAVHLTYQSYNICIRREQGFCAICYVATRDGINDDATDQQSFGLGYLKIGEKYAEIYNMSLQAFKAN